MSNDLVPTSGAPAASQGGNEGFFPSSGRAAEIRQIMATDRSRYFREGLDQELAELQQRQAFADNPEEAANLPVSPLAPHRSQAMLTSSAEGRELVAAWRTGPGGFEAQLQKVQRSAGQIVQQIGDSRTQRAFMERFDRDVTERARFHIYDELKNGAPNNPRPVSQQDIAHFGNTQAGAELLKEWGSSAPYRVSRVWARFERFHNALSDADDFASFVAWYSYLKPSAVKAICRFLSQ